MKHYLKIVVKQDTDIKRIFKMIGNNNPDILKLESGRCEFNNRVIRCTQILSRDGWGVSDINLISRFKSSKKFREHHLISVTLADEAKRGRLKRSELLKGNNDAGLPERVRR